VTDVTASPLKLFEYLAAGRVVVLPDLVALAEVLPPSVGYYFQRGNAGALAAALDRALSDPARTEREKLGLSLVGPHTYAARAEQILRVATTISCAYHRQHAHTD
jgi:glycosyltransferase involved in cell wall biosynthesis